jgi:hypothetical protein
MAGAVAIAGAQDIAFADFACLFYIISYVYSIHYTAITAHSLLFSVAMLATSLFRVSE